VSAFVSVAAVAGTVVHFTEKINNEWYTVYF